MIGGLRLCHPCFSWHKISWQNSCGITTNRDIKYKFIELSWFSVAWHSGSVCKRQHKSDSSLLLNLSTPKGWVGLVGWPIADGLPTLVATHQLEVKRRTGKVRRPETDVLVLPLCHATNLITDKALWNRVWSDWQNLWRWTKKQNEQAKDLSGRTRAHVVHASFAKQFTTLYHAGWRQRRRTSTRRHGARQHAERSATLPGFVSVGQYI